MLALVLVACLQGAPALAAPSDVQIAQAAPSLRQGEKLPDAYRNQIVYDYDRYHLRRPPSGYAWYRVGDLFVLASMSTGVIFDVVGANG
jgi:Ni/Co efflux regulator RcnB